MESGALDADRNLTINQSQPQLDQGKKSFQAKVLERLSDACVIETVIDGKLLRGVVFQNKSSPPRTTNQTSDR